MPIKRASSSSSNSDDDNEEIKQPNVHKIKVTNPIKKKLTKKMQQSDSESSSEDEKKQAKQKKKKNDSENSSDSDSDVKKIPVPKAKHISDSESDSDDDPPARKIIAKKKKDSDSENGSDNKKKKKGVSSDDDDDDSDVENEVSDKIKAVVKNIKVYSPSNIMNLEAVFDIRDVIDKYQCIGIRIFEGNKDKPANIIACMLSLLYIEARNLHGIIDNKMIASELKKSRPLFGAGSYTCIKACDSIKKPLEVFLTYYNTQITKNAINSTRNVDDLFKDFATFTNTCIVYYDIYASTHDCAANKSIVNSFGIPTADKVVVLKITVEEKTDNMVKFGYLYKKSKCSPELLKRIFEDNDEKDNPLLVDANQIKFLFEN